MESKGVRGEMACVKWFNTPEATPLNLCVSLQKLSNTLILEIASLDQPTSFDKRSTSSRMTGTYLSGLAAR